MDKNDIKNMLRESLVYLSEDKEKKGKKKDTSDVESNADRDQSSIQNAAKKDLAPSMIDVCAKALGYNPKDAGDRAKCTHKWQQKHGQGFSEDDLSRIEGILVGSRG